MHFWHIRLVVFISAFFPKFDMILEILVLWITLLTAFSHCLGSTLNQTFIMHRLVFDCPCLWYFTANSHCFNKFCRLGLTTALSHHLGRQSTSWNVGVRSALFYSLLSVDIYLIVTRSNCSFFIYVALLDISLVGTNDRSKSLSDLLLMVNLYLYHVDDLN